MRRMLAQRGAGLVALAALLACLVQPSPASAAERKWGRVADGTFDVLFLRTSGIAMLALGAVLFVPSAAVTWPGGKTPIREAWNRFIVQPTDYAIRRPIGDF
jgi:hypothetical protein